MFLKGSAFDGDGTDGEQTGTGTGDGTSKAQKENLAEMKAFHLRPDQMIFTIDEFPPIILSFFLAIQVRVLEIR